MDIQIKCTYAKSDFMFNKFEDFFHWLIGLKGLRKDEPNHALYAVAKIGHYNSLRDLLQVKSTFNPNYSTVEKIAGETKLRKTRGLGSYTTSPNREFALAFARELDKEIANQLPA